MTMVGWGDSRLMRRLSGFANLSWFLLCALSVSVAMLGFSSLATAQEEKPEWCKALPRPEYKALQRVLPDEQWFEVYKVAPQTFAIYEPHQFEETISYL